ncbi:MAG: GntR family transcriptional regulator [Novosphingobium sp.]|nr:GntR family transcriptional regulator [Novosphingobium sp.]
MILQSEDGAYLGNEESLVQACATSAPTMRQAVRILECEGLLRVRRGNGGGYFGIRPTYDSVEEQVSRHLSALHIPLQEVASVASVLWVEVVRQAATCAVPATGLLSQFRKAIDNLHETSTFHDVSSVEIATRIAIFDLVERPYFELIFRINATFQTGDSPLPATIDGSAAHARFVTRWKEAKRLELHAIAAGDEQAAMAAARSQRRIWDDRLLASAAALEGRH